MRKIILIILFLVFVGGPVGLHFFLNSTESQKDGTLVMRGLTNEVKLVRDKFGVPHIEASNEIDLHRGLGFAMAQDRLFQMDLLRRIGSGRLSEIFGEKTLEYDKLLRTLRLKKSSKEYWNNNRHLMDSKMIILVDAFFEGVHFFIKTQPLPIEFKLLGYKPEAFTMSDAMAVAGYMGLSFCEALIADPLFSSFKKDFPEKVLKELGIRHLNDNNQIINGDNITYEIDNEWYENLLDFHSTFRDYFGLFHGSNSWVLAAKKSKSGFPILANDPHIAFSNPSVWYEAHLKSPSYEIYGHFIPLSPFPGMGHNNTRGWAVTMSEVDDFDFYEEKINPENSKLVMYRNKWVEIKEYDETIKVRGKDDHKLKIRITPHGPIMDDTKYGVTGKVLSAKWSFHHPKNQTSLALYKLSRSENLKDFYKAVSYGATPSLNVSWADKSGNIAWKVMGKIPLREGFRGNQILEGWSGKHEYKRYFTSKENPGLENPNSGMIITANYYPDYNGKLPLDGYWQPAERFERINQLLSSQEKWNLEELKKVQTDQTVVTLNWMRPIYLKSLEERKLNSMESMARKIFIKWDGNSGVDSIGSSIYHKWTAILAKRAVEDEIGEKRFIAINKVADFWNFFKTMLKQESHTWWDRKDTELREDRDQIIWESFHLAIESLARDLGPNIETWKWGQIHTIEFKHPLGKVWPLNYLFNIGPLPAGGGIFQVDNMGTARYEDNFNVTIGPSTRRLIDFSKPRLSLGILPTGNSGQRGDYFYDDQVRMFLLGEYRPQFMDKKNYLSESASQLMLSPE